MRTLGILGGMSWVSTLEYYRLLNEGIRRELGGLHSARLVVSSIDFQGLSDSMADGDWAAVKTVLVTEAKRLAAAGADAILVASNTMHVFADEIEDAACLPLLHIADAVGVRIGSLSLGTVGLLGTRYSMEKDFYRKRLSERFGIESLIPAEEERAKINAIIFTELCEGKFLDASRAFVREEARRLAARGAQGIILGCTELPLIVQQEDLTVPRIDSMDAHVEAGVRFLVGDT